MGSLVKVEGRKIQARFFHKRAVLTLPQVDDFHGRPRGTAKRNFRINRKHFVEGQDYFEATFEEWNELFGGTNFVPPKPTKGGHRGSMILLTLTGYMMLVKSLTDDKAWAIHRALVYAYFAKRQGYKKPSLEEVEAFNADVLELGTKATALKHGRSESTVRKFTAETRAAKAEQVA